MTNPFRLRWLQGWTFQVVFMEGDVQVEAQGFGIRLRTAIQQGESPRQLPTVWSWRKTSAAGLCITPGCAVSPWLNLLIRIPTNQP